MSLLGRALRAVAVDAALLRRRREFRLLMVGQTVSLLGSAVTLVAIPVQMYDLTGSTVAVGLIGLTQFVPILALALLGGALADAFDRRRLMIGAELGSLAVTLALFANALLPDPMLWPLYVGSALPAGLMAILRPPLDALVPRLVEPHELPAAIIGFGLAGPLWLAVTALVVAGASDAVSAIFRGTIWNEVVPDRMRGRLAGMEMISYTAGPTLGNVEAGFAAALIGLRGSIVLGGALCVGGTAALAAGLPELWRYESEAIKRQLAAV